jgi:hypothetical protein
MICCFFLEGFFELFVGFFISGSPGSFTLCERRGYDADEYPVNAKCTVPKGTCGLTNAADSRREERARLVASGGGPKVELKACD